MARKFLTGIDLASQKLVNLADPSAGTDAVNLQTLDSRVRGLAWKDAARAASTGNVSLASPGASIDGVALTSGDRVLLKNQTAGAENGIYVWTGAAAALTRATDADSAAELNGATVTVTQGTTNSDKVWTQTADTIALGTTPLAWAQVGGGGSAYTAGNGLTLTGSDFAVGAGTGVTVAADTVAVDTSVVVRKYAANVGNGSLTVIPITHGLGTADVTFKLRVTATGEIVDTDTTITDANTITFTFATAPAAGQYRVVVHA